jgi:6-methylsalicylic acid synthase
MSCRFPCSNSVSEFWELLISGENGIGPIPPHRWLPSQGCIVEDDKVEAGFLKCPVDEIDAEFFGFTNMELKYTDPQQRMLLEVAYEALQDAGIPPKSLAEKGKVVGICSAFWKDDYKVTFEFLRLAQIKVFDYSAFN